MERQSNGFEVPNASIQTEYGVTDAYGNVSHQSLHSSFPYTNLPHYSYNNEMSSFSVLPDSNSRVGSIQSQPCTYYDESPLMECGYERQPYEKYMDRNNVAVSQLHDAWNRFTPRWKVLEGHRNSLINKWQSGRQPIVENQGGRVKRAQEIERSEQELQENSGFVQEQRPRPNEYLRAEKDYQQLEERMSRDIEYRKQEAERENNKTSEMIQKKKDCTGTRNIKQYDHELRKERRHLRDMLSSMQGKLEALQIGFSSMKNERESYNLKLNEVNRNINILEQQRTILQKVLNEYKERTESIQNDIKHLSNQIEKKKHELEFCQKLEQNIVCDKACQVQMDFVGSVSSKDKEMKLLEEKYEEELQLCKVQLAKAVKQICFLNEKLKVSNSSPANCDESKIQMHKCLSRENSNLVNDGVQLNNPLSERSSGNDDEYRYSCRKKDIPYTSHVSCPPCGSDHTSEETKNRIGFDAKLTSSIAEQFDILKQKWVTIIGEEVKRCTSDFDCRFSVLENSIQELICLAKREVDANSLNDEVERAKYGEYRRNEGTQASCNDNISLIDVEECSKGETYIENVPTRRVLQACVEENKQCVPYDVGMKPSKVDCGTGYAFNFVYGYLQYVLPRGVKFPSKGLEQRIIDYIYNNRLKDDAFPLKKLIILIPHNARNVSSNLKLLSIDNSCDGNKHWMDAAGSLETEIIVREGVERPYDHSVYKIKDPDRKGTYDYVVAEFATPLKIFSEVQSSSNPRMSKEFKMHQEKLVSLFYESLMERLRKNKDCEKLCEVIYYPDTENGKNVNIARVILDRINLRKSMELNQYLS